MQALQQLLDIMRQLRDPHKGCPWDKQQTYRSLVPYTLEEAYEVAGSIENNALDELPDELGDLLFQIVFYAQLGEEAGEFDFSRVVERINHKLIRRHPHVFAGETIDTAEEQTLAWEKHKERERQDKKSLSEVSEESKVLQGVSRALPALTRAAKLQRRAAGVGFDWPDYTGVIAKLEEELEEVRHAITDDDRQSVKEELGDLLFSCVNLARHFDIDAETALREANHKFELRFSDVEMTLSSQGGIENATLDEMEQAWQAAKKKQS